MKKNRIITGALAPVCALAALAVPAATAGATPTMEWDQGFEVDTAGWSDASTGWHGTVTRVASGTDGVTSPGGGFHAVMEGSATGAPFSRFAAYADEWPGPWLAELDVHLDPAAFPTGTGFDYSVAANGSDNAHQRDFIFHVTKDTSTGDLLVGGSNNSNGAPREDLETIDHVAITTAGWYTMQHRFRDNGGVLAVDLRLLDDGGLEVFSTTRRSTADTIPAEVGGNRYGWFTFISDGLDVPVDDHQLLIPDATVDVVNDDDVGVNWLETERNAGTGTFDEGPGTPPIGVGSYQIAMTGSADKVALLNYDHIGTRLADIDDIEYATYRASSSTNPAAQYPSINLEIDTDGSIGVDAFSTLVYEPVYPYGPGALATDTWQTWDTMAPSTTAFGGGWWSTRDIPGVCAFNCFVSWDTIVANNPDAIVLGGFGVNAGSGWNGTFSGAADQLSITVLGSETVYDFEPNPAPPSTDLPAVTRGSRWLLRDSLTSGTADSQFSYGTSSYQQFFGDWDGDGLDTPAVFNPANGWWHITNTMGGPTDMSFKFGTVGATGIVGDWDGDGIDTVGYRPAGGVVLRLNDQLDNSAPEYAYPLGLSDDHLIVGDWDGDGDDTIGVRRAASNWFHLSNTHTSGSDISFRFSTTANIPLAGDWDGDGTDTIGARAATYNGWLLRNSNSSGPVDVFFNFGRTSDTPLVRSVP